MKPSFSLKWLFVGTAVVALGAAALGNANKWWLSGFYTTTVVLLVLGTIASRSPFCRGFAIAGWTYFALSLTQLAIPAEPWLPTTQFLMWAFTDVNVPPMAIYLNEQVLVAKGLSWGDVTQLVCRHLIAQCLFTWASGVSGGLFACWLTSRERGSDGIGPLA